MRGVNAVRRGVWRVGDVAWRAWINYDGELEVVGVSVRVAGKKLTLDRRESVFGSRLVVESGLASRSAEEALASLLVRREELQSSLADRLEEVKGELSLIRGRLSQLRS